MGKENIIAAIGQKTDENCQAILQRARSEASAIVSAAQNQLDERLTDLKAKSSATKDKTVERRVSTARLEGRKYLLAQKRALLNEVYEQVKTSLKNLDKTEYRALMLKILAENAEKGETVRVSKRDAAFVDQAFLDSVKKGLKLGSVVDIDGGVIIEGDGYQKDVTFDTIIDEARQTDEMKVCEILFKEDK